MNLLENLDVKLPEKGLKRILTDNKCRVFKGKANSSGEVWDGVFAIGDAADIDGASLPTTAEVACQKAKYLVQNLNMHQSDDSFKKPFDYQQKQLVSYIGQRDGVIAGKGVNDQGWTGQSAWLAWRGSSISWNRNWRSRFMIIITWTLNLLFGQEIARL